jgi:UDP:flavonoid glycosyltransferase YjiC (YdhE family)
MGESPDAVAARRGDRRPVAFPTPFTSDAQTDADTGTEGGPDGPIRVLFVCVPAAGHVTPMLPLAREFAALGDQVIVASGPDVADAVTAAGLTHRQVGPGMGEWFGRLAARTPGPPGEGLAPEQVERYFVPRLFGEVGLAAMRDDLDALVGELRPDLLVFEPNALAAPLVAAWHGVPAVQHMIGLHHAPLTLELTADAVTPAWAAAGLPVPPSAGLYQGTTLGIYPPALDPPPAGVAVQPIRTTPLPDPSVPLPVALPEPGRPLVYVTLGTSFNEPAVFSIILNALAELPVNVLVTLGEGRSRDDLEAVPANVAVAGFVPQRAVLPHCAAVVHHGGAGTALGVLAHGLPSVVLPRGADNFTIADRMAAAGTARVVGPDDVTESAVRNAVRAVLDDPGLDDPGPRANAERVAIEIAALPGPEQVVPVLRRQARVPARP